MAETWWDGRENKHAGVEALPTLKHKVVRPRLQHGRGSCETLWPPTVLFFVANLRAVCSGLGGSAAEIAAVELQDAIVASSAVVVRVRAPDICLRLSQVAAFLCLPQPAFLASPAGFTFKIGLMYSLEVGCLRCIPEQLCLCLKRAFSAEWSVQKTRHVLAFSLLLICECLLDNSLVHQSCLQRTPVPSHSFASWQQSLNPSGPEYMAYKRTWRPCGSQQRPWHFRAPKVHTVDLCRAGGPGGCVAPGGGRFALARSVRAAAACRAAAARAGRTAGGCGRVMHPPPGMSLLYAALGTMHIPSLTY